ncbi:unannotated protein [freshwater metagenome]|uniref:Unannotated protein n=1 Tax=freshwater metagenome TaxID=449393 RepID=A0A6J6MEN4_9ZZZZ
MVSFATPKSVNTFQHSFTWGADAISAMEHPAAKSGKITFWLADVRMSALSAIKWTPQKKIISAVVLEAAAWANLNESPVISAN